MITKAELKYYASLLQKKDRDEQGKFLVEGKKLILEAMNYKFECEIILCKKEILDENENELKVILNRTIKFESISEKELRKIQSTVTSQGIIGVFKKKLLQINDADNKSELIVALDGINDPGNVGTIIRNADWFGIKKILLSDDCADVFNPKSIRASAGSIFHVNFEQLKNLDDSISDFKIKGYRVLCADISGSDLYSFQTTKKEVIIFSNEAGGPREEILKISDERITIPRKGKTESLNVASASAVILSELTKETI